MTKSCIQPGSVTQDRRRRRVRGTILLSDLWIGLVAKNQSSIRTPGPWLAPCWEHSLSPSLNNQLSNGTTRAADQIRVDLILLDLVTLPEPSIRLTQREGPVGGGIRGLTRFLNWVYWCGGFRGCLGGARVAPPQLGFSADVRCSLVWLIGLEAFNRWLDGSASALKCC